MLKHLIPVLTASALAAPAALAFTRDAVQAMSAADMVKLLSSMGMTVENKTEQDKLPWLVAKTKEGKTFNVLMFQCQSEKPNPSTPCSQIRFKLFWTNDNNVTLETVNKFNLDYVFGRGFVDVEDKTVGVDYAMNLAGGSTRSTIRENVLYFLRVVDDFEADAKP